ncbi:ADP-ribosylglycohydrolase family protein [Blautia sp. An249]|uniref:ADP-ribosylglycohydrolase family protein n=1 Tax=Blautia sp. An249 TaxID=1965603 RepID=UPI00194DC2AD|nr:ADP-ribosylglycohydrolase family protein [Blautia sp. An249]
MIRKQLQEMDKKDRKKSALLGAVIGDIAGSRFEFRNYKKKKDYHLITEKCFFTDDSVMSVAVAKGLMESAPSFAGLAENAANSMQQLGRRYPEAGYGGRFYNWIFSDNPQPYGSYGNGAAMRVGPCGQAAKSLSEAKSFSRTVTEITHNHPEALKGAEATATAVYLAKAGKSREEIREVIEREYYRIDFTLDSIRKNYRFDVSCQGSVPQALEAFFESLDFEDAVRNAISIGGDSDTIAAICGSIAGSYYGVPQKLEEAALTFFDYFMKGIIDKFEEYTDARA